MTKQIGVRIDEDLADRLDQVVDGLQDGQLAVKATRAGVARVALERGLGELEGGQAVDAPRFEPHSAGMSLSVYLGHSVAEAQLPILWELQAASAGHGIGLRLGSYKPSAALSASRKAELARADAYIAVVTQQAPNVEAEALYARSIGRPVFIYKLEGVDFRAPKGAQVLSLHPGATAAALLEEIAHQVKKVKLPDDSAGSEALGALLGVGGLLLLLYFISKKS